MPWANMALKWRLSEDRSILVETIQLKAHVGSDGILKLELASGVTNQDIEVLMVMQPVPAEPVDELGWPLGYFEETYGSLADDPIEFGSR